MWSSTCGHVMVEYDIPHWDLKFHGGKLIPRWAMKVHGGTWRHFLLAYPASTPIHKRGGLRPPPRRGAAFGRPPFVDTPIDGCRGWVGKAEIPSFPAVNFHFPPWSMLFYCGISKPTMGYHMLMTAWKHTQHLLIVSVLIL